LRSAWEIDKESKKANAELGNYVLRIRSDQRRTDVQDLIKRNSKGGRTGLDAECRGRERYVPEGQDLCRTRAKPKAGARSIFRREVVK